MVGLEQFLALFGDITVSNLVYFALAVGFLFACYKKVKKYFDEKEEKDSQKEKEELRKQIEKENKEKEREAKEIERDKNIKIALDEVAKYPQYRAQSIAIQKQLTDQINNIKEIQVKQGERLDEIQTSIQKREKNKLQDRILQNYKYYISKEKNPMQAWTEMEATAFWGLFEEYEDAGGNGFLHSTVQPAMKMLTIIKMDDIESITQLMQSRK